MPTKKTAPPPPSARSEVLGWGREYWRQSRRPLSSLALVVPLLAAYEGGLILLGSQAVRNGADVWLRQILDVFGFGQYFLLPALAVGLLLGWHYVSRDRWRVSPGVLYVMFIECAVLALALVVLGRVQGLIVVALSESDTQWVWTSAIENTGPMAGRLLGYAGAGVYEEILFRLLPLPPLLALAKWMGVGRGAGIVAAIVVTSVVFAAAHHLGPRGETWDAFSFWFRFSAGATFAILFVHRGFGIAAGTHALYDIFISVP